MFKGNRFDSTPKIYYSFEGPILEEQKFKELPTLVEDKLFYKSKNEDCQILMGIIYYPFREQEIVDIKVPEEYEKIIRATSEFEGDRDLLRAI